MVEDGLLIDMEMSGNPEERLGRLGIGAVVYGQSLRKGVGVRGETAGFDAAMRLTGNEGFGVEFRNSAFEVGEVGRNSFGSQVEFVNP